MEVFSNDLGGSLRPLTSSTQTFLSVLLYLDEAWRMRLVITDSTYIYELSSMHM